MPGPGGTASIWQRAGLLIIITFQGETLHCRAGEALAHAAQRSCLPEPLCPGVTDDDVGMLLSAP